jgi:acetamidase/formamidase
VANYTIHGDRHHWHWDNSLAPIRFISPGDRIEVEALDAGGGQVRRESTAADIASLDFARVNPVTGPIHVEGAEPGDAIKIRFQDLTPADWGWSAIIPGFGLLADDFPRPVLRHWRYEPGPKGAAMLGAIARIPLKPMVGAVGLAPAAPGAHDILPPRRVGGTMDIRDIGSGSELYLPVEVSGGLLSLGDGHAAQGDSEVCGTGLETAMTVVAEIQLVKGLKLPGPELHTPGPVTRHLDSRGYYVTTGIGPDLVQGAADAVRHMISWDGAMASRRRMPISSAASAPI